MGKYHKLKTMLEDELDKISTNGKLTTSSLEVGDKAAHFLKSIETIEAMEESKEGYAYDYMPNDYSMRGYSRGRGSSAKRDSMGRYSRNTHKDALMHEIEEIKEKLMQMED